MNSEDHVIKIIQENGIDFTATLPCDRIKNLLPLIHKRFPGVELTREEDGLGICAGAWLAGARPIMVIQSTGLGNMINALASLNTISNIPIPVLASYRGYYKEGIESQVPMGQSLPAVLDACSIPHTLVDGPEDIGHLAHVIQDAYEHNRPHVALVSPRVWEDSTCTAWQDGPPAPILARPAESAENHNPVPAPKMTRYEAIQTLGPLLTDQALVCNLGIPSKELFAVRDRALNYYMLGSMGLASSIGLGVSLIQKRTVFVLEGDGSILMNPNALISIGRYRPANLCVIAMDNAVYGSTGSQNTFTQAGIDLEVFARSCGIRRTARVHTGPELEKTLRRFEQSNKTGFIHLVLKPGNADCPNLDLSPARIARRFRASLQT